MSLAELSQAEPSQAKPSWAESCWVKLSPSQVEPKNYLYISMCIYSWALVLIFLSISLNFILGNQKYDYSGSRKRFSINRNRFKKVIHIHDFTMSNTLLADAEFTCLTYGSFLFGQIFAIFDFFFQSFWSVFTLQSILQGYFTKKNGKRWWKHCP